MATKKSASKPIFKTNGGGGLLPWLGIATIILLLDQVTKITANKLMTLHQSIPINSFFNITLRFNEGAAFSFLANESGWQRYFFTILGTVAAIVMIYMLKKNASERLFCWAISLILGGAVGNVIDRIAYGHVIDFLDVHVAGMHWPAFNIADSAICIGAILFIWDEFRRVNK